MFSNYDGVLKVDGEVGSKNAYDPRAWGKLSEAGMAKRVIEARGSALGWYIPEQVRTGRRQDPSLPPNADGALQMSADGNRRRPTRAGRRQRVVVGFAWSLQFCMASFQAS